MNRENYTITPATCVCGNKKIFEKRNNKYCSASCGATHANLNRPERSLESKKKTSDSLTGRKKVSPKRTIHVCKECGVVFKSKKTKRICCSRKCSIRNRTKGEIIEKGERKCRHCGIKFFAETRLLYCQEHRQHSKNLRMFYKFRFNVYDYPDLFNLSELKSVGFYAPRGKCGKWNPLGFSRDHRVSVSSAIKHEYDQYYISHPINCELMPHHENAKKSGRNSLTYTELVSLVDAYDKIDCFGH